MDKSVRETDMVWDFEDKHHPLCSLTLSWLQMTADDICVLHIVVITTKLALWISPHKIIWLNNTASHPSRTPSVSNFSPLKSQHSRLLLKATQMLTVDLFQTLSTSFLADCVLCV